MAKKHLVVEWLYGRDFFNFTILATKKDIPNTLPSLKLSEQRVHELVRGPLNPPPPPPPRLDNVVGSKSLDQEELKAWFPLDRNAIVQLCD